MKSYLSILALLACTSAHASTASVATLHNAVEAMSNPSTCATYIAKTLTTTYAILPAALQQDFRDSLNDYESLVSVAKYNLKTGASNASTYQKINAKIEKDTRWTVWGVNLGAPIANCVKQNISFGGKPSAQFASAQKASSVISTVQKGVK